MGGEQNIFLVPVQHKQNRQFVCQVLFFRIPVTFNHSLDYQNPSKKQNERGHLINILLQNIIVNIMIYEVP